MDGQWTHSTESRAPEQTSHVLGPGGGLGCKSLTYRMSAMPWRHAYCSLQYEGLSCPPRRPPFSSASPLRQSLSPVYHRQSLPKTTCFVGHCKRFVCVLSLISESSHSFAISGHRSVTHYYSGPYLGLVNNKSNTKCTSLFSSALCPPFPLSP